MKDSIGNIDNKPYNAIFIGATGTGKTFLSHAIGAEVLKKNKSVLYLNINEYLNSLKPKEVQPTPVKKVTYEYTQSTFPNWDALYDN